MRRIFFLIAILFSVIGFGQGFSNKGTNFWITYPAHIDGATSIMGIYITSNVNTSGTLTVNGAVVPFTVTANAVTEKFIGSSAAADASNSYVYLAQSEGIKIGAGIHVTANNPVVVYAHIIRAARSGATLLLPSNVWGRQYVVPSYKSYGVGTGQGYGTVSIVANDTNTTVQITPVVNSANGSRLANTAYTITLANPGDVYQVEFQQGADISGTAVQSISTGSGCKKIAVFSSTTWSSFGCPSPGSGDNLFQQLFPTAAWGKSFLTAPAKTRISDIIRVFVADPTAVVTKTENGTVSTLTGLVNNSFYEYTTGNPTYIQSDKPASVIQYFTTMACQSGATIGDPEMIVINPVEQTINNITVFSAHKNWINAKFPNQSNVTNCYLNIILPTIATASFKINGILPISSFIAIPGTVYSYLQEEVTNISLVNPVQTLAADSNFIAIAYGFGNVESYGYNAGTNVIDLTQGLDLQNQYATTKSEATCIGTPFNFLVKFPYQPLSITWDFGNNPSLSPNATVGPLLNPVADSSYTDNVSGKTIYVYKLAGAYTVNAVGTDTITVISNNPTSDGCGGEQKQSYNISVFAAPIANFGISTTGCLSDSVHFTDSSNASGRTIVQWRWDFGDNTVDSVQTPLKIYSIANNYNPSLLVINDIGCYSTISKPLALSKLASNFGITDTTCVNGSIVFSDSSTIVSGTILNWYWDYGDGIKDTLSTNASRIHHYSKAGIDSAILTVASSSGCQVASLKKITIHPRPIVGFILPSVCLHDKFVTFTDTTTISDSSQAAFKYSWKFSTVSTATPNPSPTSSTLKIPVVQFFSSGNYNVIDSVTSNFGCKGILSQPFTINGSLPKSIFTVKYKHAALCSNDSAFVVNSSSVDFGTISKIDLYWDLLNNPTQKTTDDFPYIGKTYAHLYPNFQQPLTKKLTVRLVAYSGISCVDTKDTIIILNASPSVAFGVMPGICLNSAPLQITQAKEKGGEPGKFSYTGVGVSNTGLFSPAISGIGIDTVYALYTSTVGCVDSAKQTKTVWPLPLANFGFSSPTCVTQSVNFMDSSIANYSNLKQWLWSFGDGQSQTNNTATTFAHTYTLVGVDTVKLHVITDSGCISAIFQKPVTVYPMPQPDFSMPIVCMPVGKAQFYDSSKIADGSQSQFAYLWGFGEPSSGTLNNSTVQNGLHNYSSVGPFSVMLTVTSKDGCVASKTQQLTEVYPQPIADFTALPTYVCIGDSIHFVDKTNPLNQKIINWYWYFGDNGATSSLQNVVRQYSVPGAFSVSLYALSNKGCYSDTSKQSVNVYPYPIVNAGPDLVVLQGGQVQIKATATGSSNYKYTWTPSNWLSSDTALQPIVINPLSDVTYTLTVVGAGSCTAPADNVFVKLLMAPVVSNAFSPNGDGINDVWTIKYLNSYPGVTVQIFDRYGRLVNDTIGYDKAWDGKLNGVDLPVGTYYYIIDPKNGRSVITGSVTILR